jgi:hypothetical protein
MKRPSITARSRRSPAPAPGPPAYWPRGTGTANSSSTPATVAWTPEACKRVQVPPARGSSSHQARTRRCTSTVNTRAAPTPPAAGQGQVGGEDHRDDGDRQQVVHHRHGQQECAQRGRQVAADYRQYRQGERDVGRGRDRPPGQRPAAGITVDQDEDHRRDDHPADRGGYRQRRSAGVTQVPGDELPFELQAGDEEEHRQQAVRGPSPQREVPGAVKPVLDGRRAGRHRTRPTASRPRPGLTRWRPAAPCRRSPGRSTSAIRRASGHDPRLNRPGVERWLGRRGVGLTKASVGGRSDIADQTSRRTAATGISSSGPVTLQSVPHGSRTSTRPTPAGDGGETIRAPLTAPDPLRDRLPLA